MEDYCIDCDRPERECACEDRLRCSCGIPAMACVCAYGKTDAAPEGAAPIRQPN